MNFNNNISPPKAPAALSREGGHDEQGEFITVTKARPCPACGRGDWCARIEPKGWLKCERSADAPHGYVLVNVKDGGGVFRPDDGTDRAPAPNGRAPKRPAPSGASVKMDYGIQGAQFVMALSDERLAQLVSILGVSGTALRALAIGWADGGDLDQLKASGAGWQAQRPDGAYSFPERDATGNAIGLSLRAVNGSKGAPTGAKRGLIYPLDLPDRQGLVLIVEGASDTAACLTLGLAAVGRPSCSGGTKLLTELLAQRDVLIVGEHDEKPDGSCPGREGARRLAADLARAWRRPVRWTMPPDGEKDVRAWLKAQVAEGLDLADSAACAAVGQSLATDLVNSAVSVADPAGRDLVCFADIEAKPVDWLWLHRIALGTLTLIAGMPGAGKTFFTMDLAASVTTGRPLPDCPDFKVPTGGVLIVNGEDDPARTLKPRLEAAGADMSRVKTLATIGGTDETGAPWLNVGDLARLSSYIDGVGDCKLVVIDPVTAFTGSANQNSTGEVRGLLGPLTALAERKGVAIVLISHPNKTAGASAMHRVLGSGAWVAAVRSAWLIGQQGDHPLRYLVPLKCNLCADPGGLSYRIEGDPARVIWQAGAVTVTADDLLAAPAASGTTGSELDEAASFLTSVLASGPVASTDVAKQAEAEGITPATLRRARKNLGVGRARVGGRWVMLLDSNEGKDAHET